ncbi:GDSL-type esterase/lipase family protein [Arcicella sp. DC2W]|uniref:GDSL-type esterase/lipase family protein n=1 Tax=Arcicella gelida TaxID=2984195 RepID=A0ABU5SBG6_9BACT|nr:GDSL-type esterase/lipase family protein [Arcicella sp. DC2W]MEA5405769.1 GDSL-type esterase/lipase family protein [Arcicella sp. DC2W]
MQKKLLTFSLILNVILILTGGTLAFKFKEKLHKYLFPPESNNILLVGDSLLAQENWALLLERNDITNLAYGGAITLYILKNIEVLSPKIKPKICVIEGGVNDLLAGVPEQRVFENYIKMIHILQKQQIKPIVNAVIYTNLPEINHQITILNQQLASFCQQNQVVYIDANQVLSEKESLKNQYSLDGIHLKQVAYPLWAKELSNAIKKMEH